ncbi:MAG: gliding motility-associated C-terminal domain-containing protein [Bacteroidota bacterium]
MMKRFTLFLFVCFSLFFSVLSPNKAKASHAAGGEIIYEWVSDSTYRVYFKFYRDCSGIDVPATVTLCYDNYSSTISATNPQFSNSVVMTKITTLPDGHPNGWPVSLGCPSYPTTCSGGTIPGYREWWYTALVTLPSRANYWRFYTGINARNAAITNLVNPGAQILYVEATFDNLDAQGNTSPYFSIKPVPYCCVNHPFTFNNGGVDPNNDSLVFSIIQPRTGPDPATGCVFPPNPTAIPFTSAAFNLTNNPFGTGNTFTFNPNSGQLSFTANALQIVVVTVLCKEYRNGIQIGSVMRDIQIIIRTCNPPTLALNLMDANFQGCQDQAGTVVGCAGKPMTFCWNLKGFTSPAKDTLDIGSVIVSSNNHTAVMPGSVTTSTNTLSDSTITCLSWTPGLTDTGLRYLTIVAMDSSCRPPGIPIPGTFTIPIYIWPKTVALHDSTVCPGTQVQLSATGGHTFTWTVIPDTNSTATAASLSCTTCPNPIVTAVTGVTHYVVTSDVPVFCNQNTDTITIRTPKLPAFGTSPLTVTTCIHNLITLNTNVVAPDSNTKYLYTWSPTTYVIGSATSDTLVVSPPNTTTYVLTVTPVTGGDTLVLCSKLDTVHVNVLQGYDVNPKDTTMCYNYTTPPTIVIQGTGDPLYTYSWNPPTGVSSTSIINPTITPVPPYMFGGLAWGQTETYTVVASYPGCADSILRVNVHLEPTPYVNVGPDRVICYSDSIHLSVIDTPTNYPLYTYLWTKADGTTIANQIDFPHLPLSVFTGYVTDTVILTLSTPNGCKGQDTAIYNVIPYHFLMLSPERYICPRDTVQLSTSGTNLVSVTWTPDFYIDDIHSASPNVWPINTTSYNVIGMNDIGCKDTESVRVTVYPGAVVSLPDSVRLYPGDYYMMNPEGNCLYYTWTPTIGLSSGNISNPVVNPVVDTKYYLFGTTENGCKSSDSIDVFVSPDSYINMPNVFTPGTGPNGKLKLVNSGIATVKLFTIYNRWGNKVFETSDINEGWNGDYKGEPQPLGVYVYVLEGYTYAGNKVTKQGNITLIR